MLGFLNLKEQAFGLDIADSSLKIVKLKKKGRFFDLASFNEAKIKPGIVRKGEIKKPEELAEIIKKMTGQVRGEKLDTKNAIVSLSEEKSFLQVIQMPYLSKEDLRSAIIFEAENYIPLPLGEVYLDYQIISLQNRQLDHLDVLIVAFPKKIIDSCLECLKKADIKPLALEVESLAISRALIREEKISQPILLVDFGANRTIFIIFAASSVMFTFSIPISSQSFTEAISRTMEIDLAEAERLKIKYGLGAKSIKTGNEIFQALIPSLSDLTEQIKKYLDYYQAHDFHDHLPLKNKKIEKILICGSGAKLKGLIDFLSSQLKVPVQIGNPWTNILSSSFQPKEQSLIYEKEQSLGYATALGLALRGIKGK